MLKAHHHLMTKQQNFKLHPFFEKLSQQTNFLKTMEFAPRLTFWIMSFQDVLRLLPKQVKSKNLRRIAIHHKIEDAGHEQWFLQDMTHLKKEEYNKLSWLFSKENSLVRDFSYSVVAEALKPSKDHLKITLILILESTGHIFFDQLANYVKLHGYNSDLKYFSSYHLDVEHGHAIFEEQLMKELLGIDLSESDRQDVIDLINRVYTGFHDVFDQLHDYLVQIETEEEDRLVA
ncbi:MAG: hypothetical protein KBD90_02075 [Alphaproteobacteria bacterium]|nr:hypothetical protein [Alphaproteobacteria bacterium]